ncbi:MAG: FHA domain-containing protein [Povalibacter sp.]
MAASEAVVEVELDFNAFADHVPPTQHAKRVASDFDPSIQDFADQALEVSALRAELKRLTRDCDALRETVRHRESLVQTLREQLSSTRAAASARVHAEETQSITPEAPHRPAPVVTLTSSEALITPEHPVPSAHEATVTPGPTAEHDGSRTVVLESSPPDDYAATITDMPQMMRDPGALESTPGRKLIPEREDGQVILLNRDVITIGRTRQNDIFIPSHAVSRDHARLLVGASSVTLFDMGSANGCFVNDEPIKRHKLRDGDRVRIGDRAYRFADHVHRTRTRAAS